MHFFRPSHADGSVHVLPGLDFLMINLASTRASRKKWERRRDYFAGLMLAGDGWEQR